MKHNAEKVVSYFSEFCADIENAATAGDPGEKFAALDQLYANRAWVVQNLHTGRPIFDGVFRVVTEDEEAHVAFIDHLRQLNAELLELAKPGEAGPDERG